MCDKSELRTRSLAEKIAEADAIYGDPTQYLMTPEEEAAFYKRGADVAARVRAQSDQNNLCFGRPDSEGMVHLLEFCPDPDGSAQEWFKDTGKTVDIDGYAEIGIGEKTHSGVCDDTGEFVSHAAALMQTLMTEAPNGTQLVIFKRIWECGTRTFTEKVTAAYYRQKS